MILSEYKEKFQKAKFQKSFYEDKISVTENFIENEKNYLISLEKAQVFLQDVAKKTQEQLRFHIKDIVQLCIDAVWPGEVEFDVVFEIKRGKTECSLQFVTDGEEIDPIDHDGGGLVHLAAFALRIAVWTLGNTRNTIILDEPLGALQPKRLQLLGFQMIKELSDKLGIQFIIVKNSVNGDDLQEISDKVFEVKRKRMDGYWRSEVNI